MRKLFLKALSVCLAAAVAGAPCAAASLDQVDGKVFVSSGQGYHAVAGAAALNLGDCVLVGDGGTATISYDDGTSAAIGPGTVRCLGSADRSATGAIGNGRMAAGAGDGAENGNGSYPPGFVMDGTTLIVAGTIAGLAGLWIALGNAGGDNPASP